MPQFDPLTSIEGDKSKHYMIIGGDCSVDMHIQEFNVPYMLVFEAEDGNCDDSFEVWINNRKIYYFTGKNKGTGKVESRRHEVGFPAYYFDCQDLTVTFRNTATDNCGKAAVYNVGLLKKGLMSSMIHPSEVFSPVDGNIRVIRPSNYEQKCSDGNFYCLNSACLEDEQCAKCQNVENCEDVWRFVQYVDRNGPIGHMEDGGIRRADDTYAWDANLKSDENGVPVKPCYPGIVIEAGGNYGEVLLEHNYQGSVWYSMYLHMANIQVLKGDRVGLDDVLGDVSDKSPSSIATHLHFAIYIGSNVMSGLKSFDADIIERKTRSTEESVRTTTLLAVSTELDQNADRSDIEQKAQKNIDNVLDKTKKSIDSYGSSFTSYDGHSGQSAAKDFGFSYEITGAKFCTNKAEASRYMASKGIQEVEQQGTLSVIDTLGLEESGFCIVTIDCTYTVFGTVMVMTYPIICNELGDPYWESWQLYGKLGQFMSEIGSQQV